MLWLALPFALAGLGWLGFVAALHLGQRHLLYRPAPARRDPLAAGAPWMEAISQGGHLLGWWSPPAESARPRPPFVLVLFHGNRGTLARIAAKTAPWRAFGLGIFAATYRGFEDNPGRPSEAGLYEDARMVLDWLARRGYGPERLVLFGESLGTGLAAQMALERPVAAVVLEAPFTSVADAAAERYPWAPVRRLLRDRFDTLSKIGRLTMPILILHGDADPTIPVAHAHRLAAAAPPGTKLVVIPGGTHIDLHSRGAEAHLAAFIKSLEMAVSAGKIEHPRCERDGSAR